MSYHIDLRSTPEKRIFSLKPYFTGRNPSGEELSFTNYYMEVNGKPYYGISGEIHYARLWEDNGKTKS